jgi:hypothetical protein
MHKRNPNLLLSIFVVIGCISLIPATIAAQPLPPQPSGIALRNAAQQSESLAKVLASWTQLQGQSITISNVNALCLGQVCFASAGGQTLLIDSEIDLNARERLLKCTLFGCPATIKGIISSVGDKPLLLTSSITFVDETQYNSQPPETARSSNQIADGKYSVWQGYSGFFIEVKGDQYRHFYGDDLERGNISNWKPVSELQAVRDGVIYYKNQYLCSDKAPKLDEAPNPRRARQGFFCVSEGITFKRPTK